MGASTIFVDTSVLVAAFGRWHERHEDARLAVQRADRVAAHAALFNARR